MTTDTLAKLAADLEQLASEGPELIHTQSGVYISQKLSEAAKALAAQDTTGAPSEPFGYFKAQPFGWTDCAETDDGAIALYEQPASQFTGAFSGIAARKLADLVDRGYRVNGYSLMHAETRARGFIDSGGFVGWWSNRDHEQAAQAPALTDHEIETLAHRMCWRYKHDGDSYGDPAYTFNKVTLIDFVRRVGAGSVSGWPALLAGAALQQSGATMESAAAHLESLPKMHQGKLLAHDLRRAASCCETALAALPQPQPQSAQTKGDA